MSLPITGEWLWRKSIQSHRSLVLSLCFLPLWLVLTSWPIKMADSNLRYILCIDYHPWRCTSFLPDTCVSKRVVFSLLKTVLAQTKVFWMITPEAIIQKKCISLFWPRIKWVLDQTCPVFAQTEDFVCWKLIHIFFLSWSWTLKIWPHWLPT